MSHAHDQPPDETTHGVCRTSRPLDAPDVTPPNVLTGVVYSRTEGLTRTTYRIRVTDHIDVRVRWPRSACRFHQIGQPVRLIIPQEAVHLEAGGFRRGKQRWNRWIGRVVLAANQNREGSITVKIHHAPITMKSRGPVIGVGTPLATWDTVNIVVDPLQVRVCNRELATRREPPVRQEHRIAAGPSSSVWLRAIVRAVRSIPLGHHLTLNVGGVTLSVLIESGVTPAPTWSVGHSLEISIGSGDAWVRHDPQGPTLLCCVVLSTEFNETHPMGFARQRGHSQTVS